MTLDTTNSGVVNRVVDKGCTIDDLIFGEQVWRSQSAFSLARLQSQLRSSEAEKITAAERSKLMVTAQASGVGVAVPY